MRQTALRVTAFLAALAGGSLPALADPPRVATDIPPVHSLVALVMQGLGEPELILPPGASPHGHSMRPSEAAALAEADLVVWMGPALTPWLERAVASLAEDARSLSLLDAEETMLLDFREGATFGAHADHESEAEGHGVVDPHAWLDPRNAALWLDVIAEALADADPENADDYRTNAAEGQAELEALTAELTGALAPLRGRPFVVFHDAYRYFENRFGVEAAGAIAIADGSPPAPARVAEIRNLVAESGAACIFAEPQFPAELIDTVTEGTGARAAVLDPVGAALPAGPDLYPQLLRGLAASLTDCLGG